MGVAVAFLMLLLNNYSSLFPLRFFLSVLCVYFFTTKTTKGLHKVHKVKFAVLNELLYIIINTLINNYKIAYTV